ncbi:hypothetical protein CEXT_267471 [Caerostris extrusa]|uniref:LAGLIDADG homing endonuclease n=1 Tax=Caerostris extrusa TaxID=172846 RepID=A0AAV4QR38_CAEEX|nr:hypothetical protein CEXT_267471 [Caerostris extrusa]
MIFVQQIDTRKKSLRKSDQHRMVKSTHFGSSGHFISEMDLFISPFLILSALQNKWIVILKNSSKQVFKQHYVRTCNALHVKSELGKEDRVIYDKLIRKGRGELSAFRIDGKKQGNRFGIDLAQMQWQQLRRK